jgi:hypothetical protein
MQEYAIQRCTRKCAKLERPLAPGERYYSVILTKGPDVVRQDIADEAWQGPPEGTIGWWRGKMPERETRTLQPAPVQVLLDTLAKLCEQPDSATLAYLLGVLLVRRRVLVEKDQTEDTDDPLHLHLTNPIDGMEFLVPMQLPSDEAIVELQKSLSELLYQEV